MQASIATDPVALIRPLLKASAQFKREDGIAVFDVTAKSEGLQANEYYFDQQEWRDNVV